LHLQSKCSTAWAILPVHFALIMGSGRTICLDWHWTSILMISVSRVARGLQVWTTSTSKNKNFNTGNKAPQRTGLTKASQSNDLSSKHLQLYYNNHWVLPTNKYKLWWNIIDPYTKIWKTLTLFSKPLLLSWQKQDL
jgi:hypothetical protein